MLRGVWHFLTVDFAVTAATCLALATGIWRGDPVGVGRFVAGHFLLYLLIWPLLAGRRLPYVGRRRPQWLVFLAIGALAWWGSLVAAGGAG